MNNAPCKDCKERYLGCHDHCSKYQEFKRKKEQERKNRDQAAKERSLDYAVKKYFLHVVPATENNRKH